MGRWREPGLPMNWQKDPSSFIELVLDQQSDLVGRESGELFVVRKYEQDRPRMIYVPIEESA